MNSPTPKYLLILEADSALSDLLMEFLGSQGCKCLVATTAQEALTRLSENNYDILIASHRLNGMKLSRFLQLARDIAPDVGLILASPKDYFVDPLVLNGFKRARRLEFPMALAELWTAVHGIRVGDEIRNAQ